MPFKDLNQHRTYHNDYLREWRQKPEIRPVILARRNSLRNEWRANGLCSDCGDTAIDGRRYCPSCRARQIFRREIRARIGKGELLCRDCGVLLPVADKYCVDCICIRADRDQRMIERLLEIQREYRDLLWKKILDHYGRACACCGEDEPRFLTLDHINNDGAEARRNNGTGLGFYSYVVRAGFPNDLQILCWNCNCAKGIRGCAGVCPHESKLRQVIQVA